jgi:hypothetical protein
MVRRRYCGAGFVEIPAYLETLMRRLLTTIASLVALTGAAAQAQDFSGTYVTQNALGGSVTLVMAQSAAGQITGSLSGGGVSYELNGIIEEGSVLGTLSSAMGGVYFAAELLGSELHVTLIEPDANNQPNYAQSQLLVFTRQGLGQGGAAPSPPAGNPLAQQPRPAQPAPGNPLAGEPVTGGAGAGRQVLQGWNIEYEIPSGWQVSQSFGRVQMLGSTTAAGGIFVSPGLYSNFDEIVADVTVFYQSLGHVAYPIEQPSQTTVAGFQAMAGLYMSQDQMGQTLHSRIISLLTPHGTGFVVTGMTTPQQMPQLRALVDRLAGTVSAQAPEVNQQAVAALRGRWMYYAGKATGVTSVQGGGSRSHEEYVTFDGVGSFQWQSSTSLSVTTPGAAGVGSANANSDQGTYTVIGNTLVVKGRQGQQAFDIQILPDRVIAGGRTYVRAN